MRLSCRYFHWVMKAAGQKTSAGISSYSAVIRCGKWRLVLDPRVLWLLPVSSPSMVLRSIVGEKKPQQNSAFYCLFCGFFLIFESHCNSSCIYCFHCALLNSCWSCHCRKLQQYLYPSQLPFGGLWSSVFSKHSEKCLLKRILCVCKTLLFLLDKR